MRFLCPPDCLAGKQVRPPDRERFACRWPLRTRRRCPDKRTRDDRASPEQESLPDRALPGAAWSFRAARRPFAARVDGLHYYSVIATTGAAARHPSHSRPESQEGEPP